MQLLCIGDIAISNNVNRPWSLPRHFIPGDETKVLFNWELPIGNKTNPVSRGSGPRLLSHLNSVNAIRNFAPGFAALATNHMLDACEEGLAQTIRGLHQAKFQTVGAGLSVNEIKKPLLWETKEGQLGIVNWVFPETHPDWNSIPGPNCWPGVNEAEDVIHSLKCQVDWVLILIHWSDELFHFPRPEDRIMAQKLVELGADIIIGHHPHVVRGMELIDSCPVFYSVGNFYFSNFPDDKGGWIVKQAPRNREALGVNISFRKAQRPSYEFYSFWQENDEVILDPHKRALQRMRLTSQPLQSFHGDQYLEWYTRRRARFLKWDAKWHYGFRVHGVVGSVKYLLRRLIK